MNRLFTDSWVRAALGLPGGDERCYRAVGTDTRTIAAESLFVALAGERFDAHDLLSQARRCRRDRRRGSPGHATSARAGLLRSGGHPARARRPGGGTASPIHRSGDRHHRPERQDVDQGDGGGGAEHALAHAQDAGEPQQPDRRAVDGPRGARDHRGDGGGGRGQPAGRDRAATARLSVPTLP